MKARQPQSGNDLVGRVFDRISQQDEKKPRGPQGVACRDVSRRMRRAGSAVLLVALVMGVTLASRAQSVAVVPAVTPNSTSLNGPGNVFLTANLVPNGGSAFGAAVSVAVADFNGDGKPDLAVADAGGNAVSILLGNGDGTFQAPKDVLSGNNSAPIYVAAGDLNGDGKPDLAVIGQVSAVPTVFILLGNGDGTFTTKATFNSFTNPQSLVLADLNGDSKLDMAVVDSGANSVIVFLGNGDGTFQAPITTSSLGTGQAIRVATGDFNKDGKLDLAISDTASNHMVVLLGNGNGTFQVARSFAFPSSPGGWDVAVGDFNGDGVPDIAATSRDAGVVNIFLGIGNGNFQPAVGYNAALPSQGPTYLAVGDFNKDGKLDIITSQNAGSSVSALFGKGDGTFSAPLFLAANHTPGQLAVADFNGDGNLDWAAGSTTQTRVTVALGNGNGTFQDDVDYAVGQGPQVAAGDFNKDGKVDLVTVDFTTADVSVLLGNGDGTFQAAIKTPVPGAYYGIAAADLDGDGNLDVVVGDATGLPPRNVNVLLGKGDGTFVAPVKYSTGGSGEGQMVLADFNGDGKLDLAVVNQADNTISLLLGNGDGTFQAAKVVTPALGSDGFLGYLVAADFNGDGKLDLAVPDYVGSSAGQVAVLLANGNGTFQAPTFLTTGGGATGVAAADVNKDGKLDLVVANQFGSVDVFLGNGNGTFNTPIVLDDTQLMAGVCCANPIPIVVAVADFNLDGNMDLFVGANRANNGSPGNFVSDINFGSQLFVGKGDGTFTGPEDYLVGAQANSLYVGDFNGDGAPDVAVGDTGENFVTVLLNQTPPPVSVLPKSLAFGNQLVGTSSATQPITIKNNGAAATTIGIVASGDFTQTNTCPVSPATLAVAASCTVNVAFKPTATGVRNGTITVTHQLAGGPKTVTLTGTGVAPVVTLGGNSIAFGNQIVGTTSAVQMVSLTNTGTAALTISSIAITGANAGDFAQTNTCGGSVAAGANCSISVTFKPTATGNRAASVTITDDAAGSPQTVTLAGTGTDFTIDIASGGSATATVTAGQTATYKLQVTPVSGFNGTVTLACTGAPLEAACTDSPASATPAGGNAAAFTTTVTTTAPSLLLPRSGPREWPPFTGIRLILLLLMALTFGSLLARSRDAAGQQGRILGMARALGLLLMVLVWAGACAGGGGGGVHDPGTPKGAHTLTVTGTSGGVSRQLQLTLNVN